MAEEELPTEKPQGYSIIAKPSENYFSPCKFVLILLICLVILLIGVYLTFLIIGINPEPTHSNKSKTTEHDMNTCAMENQTRATESDNCSQVIKRIDDAHEYCWQQNSSVISFNEFLKTTEALKQEMNKWLPCCLRGFWLSLYTENKNALKHPEENFVNKACFKLIHINDTFHAIASDCKEKLCTICVLGKIKKDGYATSEVTVESTLKSTELLVNTTVLEKQTSSQNNKMSLYKSDLKVAKFHPPAKNYDSSKKACADRYKSIPTIEEILNPKLKVYYEIQGFSDVCKNGFWIETPMTNSFADTYCFKAIFNQKNYITAESCSTPQCFTCVNKNGTVDRKLYLQKN